MQDKKHHSQDLISIFNSTFTSNFNTKLEKGGNEPVYIPRGMDLDHYGLSLYHRILFAHGFFASGMHEIAHWLVAGDVRRKQVDFGYWYIADGRNALQQTEFEKVETRVDRLKR